MQWSPDEPGKLQGMAGLQAAQIAQVEILAGVLSELLGCEVQTFAPGGTDGDAH